jgi:hypothetical protein
MKSIIKATMIKNFNLFIRVTSDNDILHAYVGAMSKKVKGDNDVSYENVSDFTGPPDLLVIRLNAITRPNKAAAGALEEAVVLRMDTNKATWLVSDTSRLFNSGSPAYSDSIKDVMSVFTRVMIAPVITNIPNIDIEQSVISSELVKSNKSDEVHKKNHDESKSRAKVIKSLIDEKNDIPISKIDSNDRDDGLSVYGVGVKKSKTFGRG